MPNANLVPVIEWYISKKFTSKVTGEVRTFGPGVGVGAMLSFSSHAEDYVRRSMEAAWPHSRHV